ncbi:hypothetical protein ACFDR8_000020 [Arthrobacter sp. MP_2.3]
MPIVTGPDRRLPRGPVILRTLDGPGDGDKGTPSPLHDSMYPDPVVRPAT